MRTNFARCKFANFANELVNIKIANFWMHRIWFAITVTVLRFYIVYSDILTFRYIKYWPATGRPSFTTATV